jgi:hypothetical protein
VAEDYYNNYQYADGWSYMGLNLGSPFITDRSYVRTNLVTDRDRYFVNNRVFLVNFGFEGAVKTVFILEAMKKLQE